MDFQTIVNQYIQKWYLAKLNNRKLTKEIDELRAEIEKLKATSKTDKTLMDTLKVSYKPTKSATKEEQTGYRVKSPSSSRVSNTNTELVIAEVYKYIHKKSFPQFLKNFAVNNFQHIGTQTTSNGLDTERDGHNRTIENLGTFLWMLKRQTVDRDERVDYKERNGVYLIKDKEDGPKTQIKQDENNYNVNTKMPVAGDQLDPNNLSRINEELKKDNARLINRIKVHLDDNIKLKNELRALKAYLKDSGIEANFRMESYNNLDNELYDQRKFNEIFTEYDKKAPIKPVPTGIYSKIPEKEEKDYSDRISEKEEFEEFIEEIEEHRPKDGDYDNHIDTFAANTLKPRNTTRRPQAYKFYFSYEYTQPRINLNIDRDTQTVTTVPETKGEPESDERQSFSSRQELLAQTYESKIKYLYRALADSETELKTKTNEANELKAALAKQNADSLKLRSELEAARETFRAKVEGLETDYNAKLKEYKELYVDFKKKEIKLEKFIDFLFKEEQYDILEHFKTIDSETEKGEAVYT